jgi:hypothetical protein
VPNPTRTATLAIVLPVGEHTHASCNAQIEDASGQSLVGPAAPPVALFSTDF